MGGISPPIGKKIDYLVLELNIHSGDDTLIIKYLRDSLYYEQIFGEEEIAVLKRTDHKLDKIHGANYVLYRPDGRISISDKFEDDLEIKEKGVFSMLYFPESKYRFRNLLGEGIPIEEGVALEISGKIRVRQSGQYQISVQSAGKYAMKIDGQALARSMYLSKGDHPYQIKYLDPGGEFGLKIKVVPPTGEAFIISDQDLVLP
ncbi:hypothetical protein ACFL4J_00890 [Candidatus Margulisiibacteriota bacterium]